MTSTIGISEPPPSVLPLLAKVEVIPGESLMSLITRACEANVFPRVADLLATIDIRGMPSLTPIAAVDRVRDLADLLGVAEEEVATRLHPTIRGQGRTSLISWGGLKVERRFLELNVRRVAPEAMYERLYHRSVWNHRALTFCPVTFEHLISSCPSCGQTLGWSRTHGPGRCEHCEASLLDSLPAFVPYELHAKLTAATDLISHDPQVRAAALSCLPSPFNGWDAGELFSAIVEFGVAWEHPGEGRGSAIVSDFARGRLGFLGPQHIASGYDVVAGWPDSFAALVGRIWRAVGAPGRISLLQLGPFGRHLLVNHSDTPLRQLLRENIAAAALTASVPIRLGSISHMAAEPVAETLTLNQAEARFGINKRTLRRLVPNGESFVTGRLGVGSGVRLNRARMEATASAYDRAILPESVAARLGVPTYCLQAFVEAGLFSEITDPDAKCLAAREALYDRASFEKWLFKVESRNNGIWADTSLASVLQRQFSPRVWAKTFQAVAGGKIGSQCLHDEGVRRPLSRQLLVNEREARTFISKLRPGKLPLEATMTGEMAGALLGIKTSLITGLISEGYLAGSRRGRLWEVQLEDLKEFDKNWILSPEGKYYYLFEDSEVEFPVQNLKIWRRNIISNSDL